MCITNIEQKLEHIASDTVLTADQTKDNTKNEKVLVKDKTETVPPFFTLFARKRKLGQKSLNEHHAEVLSENSTAKTTSEAAKIEKSILSFEEKKKERIAKRKEMMKRLFGERSIFGNLRKKRTPRERDTLTDGTIAGTQQSETQKSEEKIVDNEKTLEKKLQLEDETKKSPVLSEIKKK